MDSGSVEVRQFFSTNLICRWQQTKFSWILCVRPYHAIFAFSLPFPSHVPSFFVSVFRCQWLVLLLCPFIWFRHNRTSAKSHVEIQKAYEQYSFRRSNRIRYVWNAVFCGCILLSFAFHSKREQILVLSFQSHSVSFPCPLTLAPLRCNLIFVVTIYVFFIYLIGK